ncbi:MULTISPECIES: peptide deformylase [unclassified Leeuwenhoekiella]|uniref:peptide deformylase n=1 Tax=unclassified Leeuwenhoekiella TaxID=2615029 RepID=UPI000C494E6A|nr:MULTISPECIES: peptide deformylase [unclassified Leeuwenhoekiella]MAW94197.1 peptide deformylase [Leeuwenhoekiella sp.]MAW96251.1 peptide deformylase [Leeuwenhoekiella sp.]MBA80245.1 peptide deformylase [Leeuwenhoekiella sp.]
MKKTIFFTLFVFCVLACETKKQKPKVQPQFTTEQAELIMAADSVTPMRVFKITNESDSLLLRTPSEYVKVDPQDTVLQNLIARMYATVRDSLSLGAGIAAPQVGILKNIAWVQRFDKDGFPFEVIINPVIKQYSKKKQDCPEGCLSIPGRRDTLSSRAYAILVEYDKPDASHEIEMVEDFTAVVFQHEIDHLNGILYLDHLKQEVKDAQGLMTIDTLQN